MKQRLIFVFAIAVCLPVCVIAREGTHAQVAQSANVPPVPNALWEKLAQGNRDFVAGKMTYQHIVEDREHLRDHQQPPITILGCSDSRVPPELVFDQSLGSLFVVRVAGNVADEFGVASIEYAIANGYTQLIVVLGHAECGAVKAAVRPDDPSTPALRQLVKRIRTSFAGLKWDGSDPAVVRHAVEMNARAAAAALLADSTVVRDAVLSGKVLVVTAYYDLATGEVRRLD